MWQFRFDVSKQRPLVPSTSVQVELTGRKNFLIVILPGLVTEDENPPGRQGCYQAVGRVVDQATQPTHVVA